MGSKKIVKENIYTDHIYPWYGLLSILRNYNSTGKDQLEKIERTLNKYYAPHVQQKETEFKQYNIEYKKGDIGFMSAARLFALFISGVAGATLFINACQSLSK